MQSQQPDPEPSQVRAVYELREAGVEHGLALARVEAHPSREARDQLLDTQIALEEKTVRVMDDCAENAEEAVAESRHA